MFSEDLVKKYPAATSFLKSSTAKNRLANSYIFIGSCLEDITLISRDISKALNCKEGKNFTPCNKCINCNWLNSLNHPQAFINIIPDQKSKKELIKLDQIRDLLNTIAISSDYFRVILFGNSSINNLSQEACALLLKTIESAPKNLLFIFANSTKHDILPTILSRSQIIYLTRETKEFTILTNNDLNKLKEKISLNPFNLNEAIESTRLALEVIEKNEIAFKDFLTWMSLQNYNQAKKNLKKQNVKNHELVSNAYLKHKSFVQSKIILEDLFFNLSEQKN